MSPKTYFLVPHFDFPANGPVALGSIIRDRMNPGRSLNQNNVAYVSPELKNSNHKYNWQHTIESIINGKVSVWARCVNIILGLSGNLGASFDARTTEHYSFQDLETIDFSPTPGYIQQAVSQKDVQMFLEGSSYTVPIYMITGLKIVRGPDAQVTSRRSTGREGHAQFGIPAVISGYPFAVDAGHVSLRHDNVDDTSFGGGSDFVFAYRLGKISFKRNLDNTPVPVEEDFIEGAMLGVRGAREKMADDPTLLGTPIYEEESVGLEGLSEIEEVFAFDEEDELECRCIVVPSRANFTR